MRARRRWKATVGLVGPSDVRDLQTKVRDYRAKLTIAIEQAGTGSGLTESESVAFADLTSRCVDFELESTDGPLAYVYAGGMFERGRQLIGELDEWQAKLSAKKGAGGQPTIPNVPAPLPVPGSDFGPASLMGVGLLVIVGFLLFKEFKR